MTDPFMDTTIQERMLVSEQYMAPSCKIKLYYIKIKCQTFIEETKSGVSNVWERFPTFL